MRGPRGSGGVRGALRMFVALGLALILAGQLGRWFAVVDPLNALLAPLLLALVVLLASALWLRDGGAAAGAILALMVSGFQLGGAIDRGSLVVDGPRLRVLTLSTWHDNPAPRAIARVVADAAPDIAIFEETDGTAGAVIDRLLPGYARVKSCLQQHCSLTILSRWPARRVLAQAADPARLPDVLVAQVDAPFGPLRVIGVHLPRPSHAAAPLFYADLIANTRAAGSTPLIVAGDFNMATGSFGLSRFAQRTGLHAAEGFVPTYPARYPLPAFAGIDHVFASGRGGGCRRTASGGSDHFGLVCELTWPAPSAGSAVRSARPGS